MITPPDDEEDPWVDGDLESGADDAASPPEDSQPPAGDIPSDADVDLE